MEGSAQKIIRESNFSFVCGCHGRPGGFRTAGVDHLSELPERSFFQSDGASKPRRLPIRLGRFRLSFCIRYISSGVLRNDRDRRTTGEFVGFSVGAHGSALEKISRTLAARADFSFAGGIGVRLCRRRRSGGILLSLDQVASRNHSLASLLALRLDCDRRAHSCAAFIAVCFLGAAEFGPVRRGSSAAGWRR